MMLRVLSTGSHGNVYLLQDGDEILILDAGLPIRRIIDAIDNPENVVGCLVTHEHGDHSKAAYDLAKRGIKVYASAGTWAAIQGDKPRLWSQCYAYKNWSVGLGRYQVFPFPTEHDAAEPMGFVIRNNATYRISDPMSFGWFPKSRRPPALKLSPPMLKWKSRWSWHHFERFERKCKPCRRERSSPWIK